MQGGPLGLLRSLKFSSKQLWPSQRVFEKAADKFGPLLWCYGFIISSPGTLENCTNFLGFSSVENFSRGTIFNCTASKGDCFIDAIMNTAALSE